MPEPNKRILGEAEIILIAEKAAEEANRATRGEMERIAEEASKRTVKRVMQIFGIDLEHPEEAQRSFAMLFRAKKMTDSAGMAVVFTAVGMVISGLGVLVWNGFQKIVGKW